MPLLHFLYFIAVGGELDLTFDDCLLESVHIAAVLILIGLDEQGPAETLQFGLFLLVVVHDDFGSGEGLTLDLILQALPLILFLHLLSALPGLSQLVLCNEISVLLEYLCLFLAEVLREAAGESVAD